MGTWGAKPYENDTALDWASETGAGIDSIKAALHEVNRTSKGKPLDSDVGCVGIAACEALHGYHNPKPGFLDRLKGVFGCKQKPIERQTDLIAEAHKALDRIAGANSELAELWAESKDKGDEWRGSIADLRQRLGTL